MDNTQQQIHLSDEERAAMVEYKRIKDAMKDAIKEMSGEQSTLKFLRMSDEKLEIHGIKRTGTQSEVQRTVALNSVDIRHLLIAYAIFRNTRRVPRMYDIPEQNYTWDLERNRLKRRDGKAITRQENAPKTDYILSILDKYGARSKTVRLGA